MYHVVQRNLTDEKLFQMERLFLWIQLKYQNQYNVSRCTEMFLQIIKNKCVQF